MLIFLFTLSRKYARKKYQRNMIIERLMRKYQIGPEYAETNQYFVRGTVNKISQGCEDKKTPRLKYEYKLASSDHAKIPAMRTLLALIIRLLVYHLN